MEVWGPFRKWRKARRACFAGAGISLVALVVDLWYCSLAPSEMVEWGTSIC